MLDAELFGSPTAEFRPVAMWFLNGRLEDDELRRQIGEMARGGIGAIQVAARTGLEIPYLSERWFDLIRLVLDEAHRHGIAVWLADEYPYPSGASGGELVLRHPRLRAWQMQARHVSVAAGDEVHLEAPGSVALRTVAVPCDAGRPDWNALLPLDSYMGLVQREQVLFQPSSVFLTTRRYMSNRPVPTLHWRAPGSASRWEVWLIAAAEIADYKFFGSYVDLLNPEACQLFIDTTYARYFERLGPRQFAQLTGFFVDEAHPQNWSWCLPDAFRQRNGYDLLELLPALWTDMGPETARVRYDFWQTITEQFIDCFHKPLAAWCSAHGVQLSLEVPSTRNIVQRHADVPGIDPGHDKVGTPLDDILARELVSYRGNLTFPASLAAQSGHQRVLDELFHSVGWSLTLQDMKAMLDRAAARGANLFAFHAFCYTIGGMRKWDAPPSEFEQNPYWPHFSQLSTYAGRLAYALSRGKRAASIAVVDPVSTLWTHQDPASKRDDVAQQVAEQWASILRELTAAQRPHDTLDPLILAEAEVVDGRIRVGDATYEVVVLPPIRSLERAAWNKLDQFAAAGGTVIARGEQEQPAEQIERDHTEPSSPRFVRVASTRELLDVLEYVLPAQIRVVPRAGATARRDFLVAQRRDGDMDLFLIVNSSADEQTCDVVFRERSSVTRFDLETGDQDALPLSDDLRARVHFAPYSAELLLLRPAVAEVAATTEDNAAQTLSVGLDGGWRCTPADANVLRLDRFALTIDDNPAAVDVAPKPLINTFQDIVGSGQPWPGELNATPIFGALPRIQLRLPAAAKYTAMFDVQELPPRAVVCIEELALSGEWSIALNGTPLEFVRGRRWDIGNQEADVKHLLRTGLNQLDIDVSATEPWDGLLDAVYLLGDFGVFFTGDGMPTVRNAPASLRWSERHTSGFPYYAGTLNLTRSLRMPPTVTRIRLPDSELMFAGVAELSVDGQSLGVRAWAPFAWTLPDSRADHPELTLSITNTLVEQLEGRRYVPAARAAVSIRP